jgi:hypothetical protein
MTQDVCTSDNSGADHLSPHDREAIERFHGHQAERKRLIEQRMSQNEGGDETES